MSFCRVLCCSQARVGASAVALSMLAGITLSYPALADDDAVQPYPSSEPSAPRSVERPTALRPEPKDEQPKDVATKGPAVKDNASNDADAGQVKPSSVNAVYRINWLGTNVGSVNLKSTITNRQYTLQANADVSVFFGSFTWQGVTSSHGLMTANGPVPQGYSFRYNTGEKREAVELRFTQRMVRDIVINPPPRSSAFGTVPLTAVHLQNVVDPLSAVILISQARLARGTDGACNRRIPIFDGRVRYDLVLSPKGTRQIGNSGKLRGTAYVCSVRYQQIAGHKAGKKSEGDYVSGNTGIEVWLVPINDAGLLAPYYITVPTPAGTASMTSVRFDVEKLNARQAAAAGEKG